MPWTETYLGGSLAAEEALFHQFARDIATIQEKNRAAANARKFRRGFHAKRHIATHDAKFMVNEVLPPGLSFGLFQPKKAYRATVRFSNAAGTIQHDRAKDERGIAVRLWEDGQVIQDFLLSNSPASHARDAGQFMAFGLIMATYGQTFAIPRLVVKLGLSEAARILTGLVIRTSRPVPSLAWEQFWSRTPYALGSTALKFSLVPLQEGQATSLPTGSNYLRDDLVRRLTEGPLTFSFRVQEWGSDEGTPIEDGVIAWNTPFTELARLELSRQDLSRPEGEQMAAEIDRLEFTPWTVTTTLRPLGSLNRARQPVYRASAERRRKSLPVELAENQETTPFDYIIVGSGAGGGPLAARLARAGKTVLLIEAGKDPAYARPSPAFPSSQPGEVHDVPGYYAAATEDPEMSWMFSVRHYENDARQQADAKYNAVPVDPNSPVGVPRPLQAKFLDPQPPSSPGKRGIFYPRSSGIGGCTAHHAMIVVAPNDRDWDEIAQLTGDPTWAAQAMHPYFTKLEQCLYQDDLTWTPNLKKIQRRVLRFLGIRPSRDNSGHGDDGWQPTSHVSRGLILAILENDWNLIKLLLRATFSVFQHNQKWVSFWKRALIHFKNLVHLLGATDFNSLHTRRTQPEGVFPIPLGTENGRRVGVREFLQQTQDEYPERLTIAPGIHVTKVLFKKDVADAVPRAIGVQCCMGDHLYEASPIQGFDSIAKAYFCRAEIVLSGGSFNTPQILMLSGIGEQEHLETFKVPGLCGADGNPLPEAEIVHLPGVGKNLQDRYEISVVSRLDKDLSTLNGVSFRPGDLEDAARQQWMQSRTGLYATNGGILAVVRRSAVLGPHEREPDQFIFGVPAAFRGYYWNWSRELLRPVMGEPEEERKLWSWVILKAYTQNNGGTVRLKSNHPLDTPDICFSSFEETPGDPGQWQKDLGALVDAVQFVRGVNADNPKQFVEEIQPGEAIVSGSNDLEEWIKNQAWGHHACGTCRIGADAWRAETSQLMDPGAVLDSKFRVHGVTGLRVVDASVFPTIPGYFIVAPIFMISEKAADVML